MGNGAKTTERTNAAHEKFVSDAENLIRNVSLNADQHDYFKKGFEILRQALYEKKTPTENDKSEKK